MLQQISCSKEIAAGIENNELGRRRSYEYPAEFPKE